MPTLRETLTALAEGFVEDVLRAVRSASLEDLAEASLGREGVPKEARGPSKSIEPGRGGAKPARAAAGKRIRRSPGELEGIVDAIVRAVASSDRGLRAEAIREKLGIDAGALARPLGLALERGRLRKTGERRATTYFASAGSGAAGASGAATGRERSAGALARPADPPRVRKREVYENKAEKGDDRRSSFGGDRGRDGPGRRKSRRRRR